MKGKRGVAPAAAPRRMGRRKALVVALVLCVAATGLVSAAQWGRVRTAGINASLTALVPEPQGTPFSPSSPSKEYVYAGSRLVAIEEPGAAATPTPTPTPSPTPTPWPPCTPPSSLIISEFRMRGSAGAADEFVELYNNSASAITVCTADQSAGWTLAARSTDGTSAAPVFTVPHGTVIPARGHYLGTNSSAPGGYSLGSYPAGAGTTATGDITFQSDIADDSGLALFNTANPANFTAANRLDAVGFSGPAGTIPDLYREGSGLIPVGANDGQYTFARRFDTGYLPQDTNDNVADWHFLATDAGVYGGVQSQLGSPGPENLTSPVVNLNIHIDRFDVNAAVGSAPNRVRKGCVNPPLAEECDPNRSATGTMSMRRRVTNYTGAAVSRLRFRIYLTTTAPAPAGMADLRAITSSDIMVNGQSVKGTTLEEPPAQALGGGWNSTWTVALPTPLAAGASVNVQFFMGVQQTGNYGIWVYSEALP